MASYIEKETQAYLEGFSSRRRAKNYSERCRRESGKRQKESAEL